MKARVLPTHTFALFQAAVTEASQLLGAGNVVVLPTETVYGLAANALNEQAVAKIFEIKGRPANNPIIVHIATPEMARECAGAWPAVADKLVRCFWPGPLTLVLPRSPRIPPIVTAQGATVGLRWPSHPFMQAVIRQCGFPLAAPSANLSNQLSPTNAEHAAKSLGDKVPLIVDGGAAQVGIESTVLDLTVSPPRVLRPGMIHEEILMAAIGPLGPREHQAGGIVKSPGMLPKHYAPRAKLVTLTWRDEADLRAQLPAQDPTLRACHVLAHTRIPSGAGFGRVSVIPHDPEAFARAFYAELHRCDEAGAELIIVEALPETGEWKGLADRLKRAAGPH